MCIFQLIVALYQSRTPLGRHLHHGQYDGRRGQNPETGRGGPGVRPGPGQRELTGAAQPAARKTNCRDRMPGGPQNTIKGMEYGKEKSTE